MIDPSDGLLLAMMRERAQRAEQAAASSIKHMMEYVRATDAFFKVWGSETATSDEKVDVLEALRVAHNDAVNWAKEESAHIYGRRT